MSKTLRDDDVALTDPTSRLWLREPVPATAWNDCPCRILQATLRPEDTLPDHVCADTAYLNVVDHLKRDPYLVVSDEQRQLLLVIRRWVETPDDHTLANLLADDDRWIEIVERYRQLYWDDLGAILWRFGVPSGKAEILHELSEAGLPNSPSMIDYLFAHVVDGMEVNGEPILAEDAASPSYGALITTLVWSTGVEVEISARLDLARDSLFDAISESAREIRDWLPAIGAGRNPLTDKSAIRRAALRAGSLDYFTPVDERLPDDPHFDFIAEALAPNNIDDLRARATNHLNGREGAISDYLQAIGRRVSKRRRDAGLPSSPPSGWRDDVRPRIRELLKT